MYNEDERLKITNDWVFKQIFGNQKNSKLLINLLEGILERKITKIEITKDASLEKQAEKEKLGIMDIKALIDDIEIVNIEIQVRNQNNMIERSLFYWAGLYRESLEKGENYNRIKKTIGIRLLEYNIFDTGVFHEIGRIKRDYENTILTDKLELHFIQMPKYLKAENKYETKLGQWLALLSNEKGELEKAMKENKKELKETQKCIKEAEKELEYLTGDEEAKRIAFLREKYIRDEATNLYWAKEEGKQEGKQEGIEETAKEMLKENMPIELISKVTKLSVDRIKELRKTLK